MSEDDKDRWPWWPIRNNRPLPKIAAWMAFGVIGGGALNVLFSWLLCLVTNWGFVVPIIEADLQRSFAIGAISGGLQIGALIACTWWRTRPLT